MNTRSIFSWIATGFAVFFFIPSFLIMVSWNAIPGDKLYSLKTGIEDASLSVLGKTKLASSFSVKYTDRRYSEAIILLDKKGSTAGYTLLVAEAKESKNLLIETNNAKNAQELIAKIEQYQEEIEQKKVLIQTGQSTVPTKQTTSTAVTIPTTQVPTQPSVKTPSPVKTTIPVSTPVPAPPPVVTTAQNEEIEIVQAESEEEVIEDLEDTQEELEDIIDEIEHELPEQASFRAQEQAGPKDKKEKDE